MVVTAVLQWIRRALHLWLLHVLKTVPLSCEHVYDCITAAYTT